VSTPTPGASPTSPLSDPQTPRMPTDRESLRQLVDALASEADILHQLAYALALEGGLDPQLIALQHQAADTDGSLVALHHTLGAGARQSSAGNHDHGVPRIWRTSSNVALATVVAADAEAKDTGIGDRLFTAKSSKEYLIIYTARVASATADASVDLRLRYTVGVGGAVPVAVTTAATLLYGHSVPGVVGLPATATVLHSVSGAFLTGGVAQLPVNVAAFHDVVTGGGTVTIAQSTGALRRLIVMEGAAVT
jgi:hypothetical protein